MSRVGNLPIPVPDGVTIQVAGTQVTVNGPKGELEQRIPAAMKVTQEDGAVRVQRPSDGREDRSLHGLTRTLIANMVVGVTAGYVKVLELRGVGYRAEVQGGRLVLQAGFSHPVEVPLPEGIEVDTEQSSPTADNEYLAATITCRGADKQVLGDFAASTRRIRPVEPYKGKGLRYRDEHGARKLGKAAKGAQTVGF